MDKLKDFHRKFRFFIRSQELRYLAYRELPFVWVKNRKLNYKIISLNEASGHKKSDTIFVLGSGPSVSNLAKEQWECISKHDSFGINFSFLLNFVPTFYSMEDGKIKWYRDFIEQKFKPYRKRFSETIWFISERHTFRFIHPRLTPGFFPVNPMCCFYDYPRAIELKEDRDFTEEDFTRYSLVYRGSLSVVLHLVDRIGYKNIVLLGVDLHTCSHFFDDLEYMEPCVEKNIEDMKPLIEKDRNIRDDGEVKFESMIPKGGKYRTMEEYLYALNDLYLRPNGRCLYVPNRNNMLYPRLDLYPWRNNL